jgi:hypothetical protein
MRRPTYSNTRYDDNRVAENRGRSDRDYYRGHDNHHGKTNKVVTFVTQKRTQMAFFFI